MRYLDFIPKNVVRDGRRAELFTFENYHHKIAERLNVGKDCIRLWLIVTSRNKPRFLCVSSFRSSDVEGKSEDKLWLKHCEMVDISKEKFTGGLLIEIVQRDANQWELKPDFSSAKIFHKRTEEEINHDALLQEFYEKHAS